MAIGLVLVFLEGPLIELFQAETANEVLRVKLPEHGRDATPRNGLLAARAEAASHGVVMGLAVRLVVVLKVVSCRKWLMALSANKAICIMRKIFSCQKIISAKNEGSAKLTLMPVLV